MTFRLRANCRTLYLPPLAARAFFGKSLSHTEIWEVRLNALADHHKELDDHTKLFREATAHAWSSHFSDALPYLAVGWNAPVAERELKVEPAELVPRSLRCGFREGT